MIKKRLFKKRDWFFDVIIFFIFEKQNSIKFSLKNNYKNTIFFYINFLQQYNWLFIKKHSAVGYPMLLDLVAYHNTFNLLKITQLLSSIGVVRISQFFSFKSNKHVFILGTEESKNYSVSKLWGCATFYEREMSEMFGKVFECGKDSRRLLLDYLNYSSPLLRSYDQQNNIDLRYSKYTDSNILKFSNITSL